MEPENYEHVRKDGKLMVFFKGTLIGYARCENRHFWMSFDHNDVYIGLGTKKEAVAHVKKNHLRKGG